MDISLTDDQFINAVNTPWLSEMNPTFIQLGQDLLKETVEYIDIIGLARKVFSPRKVKAGEVIRFDKDRDAPAYIISEDGNVAEYDTELKTVKVATRLSKDKIEAVARGDGSRYVYPDEFEITAYPSMPKGAFRDIDLAKEEVKKIQEKALFSINYQEDTALIKLLKKVGEQHLNIKADPYNILDNLIQKLDSKRFICDNILLNKKDVEFIVENKEKFKDLELFNTPKNYWAKSNLREAGYVGRYKASMLITTAEGVKEDIIPAGRPIAVTNGSYIGGMPIRVPLFCEPVSEEIEGVRRYGWFWYELISMLVINPNAVILGGINY